MDQIKGPASRTHKIRFRPDIEGMRAIAIGLVVTFHAGFSFMSGGFVGVDVFFALSGYLITSLMLAEHAETGRIALLAFYARRARRLLPAMSVVLLTTVAASSILLSPIEQAQIARTALATALYASNLYFGKRTANYWDAGAAGDPLLHTWSLSVEEQFYFVWPLVLLLIFSLARKAQVARRKRFVVAMVAAGVVASFATTVALMDFVQAYAFFLPVARAWEFGAGALLAVFGSSIAPTEQGEGRCRALPALLLVAGLAAIVIPAFLFDERTRFPGVTALFPVVGTILCLRAGELEPRGGLNRWLLQNRVMLFLGRLSYSWYLWHWPVFAFVVHAFGPPTWTTVSTGVLASLGLAILSYRWVESPLRYGRRLQGADRSALLGAVGLTALSVTVALGSMSWAAHLGMEVDQRPAVAARDDFPLVYTTAGCIAGPLEREPTGCTFAPPRATADVFLIGDSHAAAWFPAIHEIAKKHSWRLTVHTKTQCPMADVDFVGSEVGRQYVECTEWRQKVLQIVQSAEPDFVFVGNAQGYTLGSPPRIQEAAWLEGLSRTLENVSAIGKRVIVLRDAPFMGFDVPSCLSRIQWGVGFDWSGCTVQAQEAYQDRLFGHEMIAASKFENLAILDLSGAFCRDGICPSVVDGQIAYRDSNHLTASFSAGLWPLIEAAMSEFIVGQ